MNHLDYRLMSTLWVAAWGGLVLIYFVLKRQASKADVEIFTLTVIYAAFLEALTIGVVKGSDELLHHLATRHGTHWLVNLQWPIALLLLGVGGYLLAAWPVIRRFESGADIPEDRDFRTRAGIKILSGENWPVFIAASIIGGSLGVAWYYARKHDPRVKVLAWISAFVFAASWNAIYLGIFTPAWRAVILWVAAVLVLVGFVVGLKRRNLARDQRVYGNGLKPLHFKSKRSVHARLRNKKVN
ncbi:MAG: hypothetical protein ACHQUB_00050 [Candidatus Saccharimonadia bacterium]